MANNLNNEQFNKNQRQTWHNIPDNTLNIPANFNIQGWEIISGTPEEIQAQLQSNPTIYAMCDICGATASGTKDFLLAYGWSFGGGAEFCAMHD